MIKSFIFISINIVIAFAFKCIIPYCDECSESNDTCTKCSPNTIYQKDEQACVYIQPCSLGTYKSSSGACLPCDSSCDFCWGPYNYQCYSCYSGYFKSILPIDFEYSKCVTCPTLFCSQCDLVGICTRCQNEYYFDSFQKICVKCIENCENCDTDKKKCDKCKFGYYYDEISNSCKLKSICLLGNYLNTTNNGSCQACSLDCKNCYGPNIDQCYECADGYYFDFNNTCKKCDSKCKTCDDFSDVCTSCPIGKVLRGDDCYDKCENDEYYDIYENRCKDCDIKCGRCQGSSENCIECYDEIYYDLVNGKCERHCPIGKFPQMNSDEINVYFDSIYYEYLQLDNSSYINISLEEDKCLSCSSNCKNCYVLDYYCTECNEGSYLQNYNCVQKCEIGYFPTVNELTKINSCQKCPNPCKNCSNYTYCNECNFPFIAKNGSCYLNDVQSRTCKSSEYQISVFCGTSCPQNSFPMGRICYCNETCRKCSYEVTTNSINCLNCKNISKYSYNGLCIDKCVNNTWLYKNSTQSYCYDQCPSALYKMIKPNDLQCLDKCPDDSFNQKGICVAKVCPAGYYFNDEKAKNYTNNSTLNISLNQYIDLFCAKCHKTCLQCNGSLETDCTICLLNYIMQPQTIPNSSYIQKLYNISKNTNNNNNIVNYYSNNGKICGLTCPIGFNNLNGLCVLCLFNCKICNEYLFLFENNCYDNCPIDSILENKTCKGLSFKLELYYGEYASYVKNLEGSLILNGNIQQINSINCSLINQKLLNTKMITMNTNNYLIFTNYKFSIPKTFLNYSTNYTLVCQVSTLIKTYYNSRNFSTYSEPIGEFNVSPKKGVSLLNFINFSIKNWMIPEDSDNKLILTYAILFELNNKMYKSFQASDKQENINGSITITKFKDENISIILPYVEKTQNTSVILEVYNDNVFKNVRIPIEIIENNQDYLKEITNVNISEISIQTLLALVRAFVESNQKLIYSPENNNLNCSKENDCSDNGVCNRRIRFPSNKCSCKDDFFGYKCSWTKSNFLQARNITIQVLNYLSKIQIGNYLMAEILTYMLQLVDVFNKDMFLSVIPILDILSIKIEDQNNGETLLKVFDNFLNLFKVLNNRISFEAITTTKIFNMIDLVMTNIGAYLSLYNFNYKLNFYNFAITTKSFEIGLNLKLYTNLYSNMKISIDFNNIDYLSYYASNYYSQIIELNSEPFYNNYDFVTNLFSFQIKTKSNRQEYLLNDTNDNEQFISLTLPIKNYMKKNIDCKFYNKERNNWSGRGIRTEVNEDSIICKTNHLTYFAAFNSDQGYGNQNSSNLSSALSILILFAVFSVIFLILFTKSANKIYKTSQTVPITIKVDKGDEVKSLEMVSGKESQEEMVGSTNTITSKGGDTNNELEEKPKYNLLTIYPITSIFLCKNSEDALRKILQLYLSFSLFLNIIVIVLSFRIPFIIDLILVFIINWSFNYGIGFIFERIFKNRVLSKGFKFFCLFGFFIFFGVILVVFTRILWRYSFGFLIFIVLLLIVIEYVCFDFFAVILCKYVPCFRNIIKIRGFSD